MVLEYYRDRSRHRAGARARRRKITRLAVLIATSRHHYTMQLVAITSAVVLAALTVADERDERDEREKAGLRRTFKVKCK